jgi:hypothetical protein
VDTFPIIGILTAWLYNICSSNVEDSENRSLYSFSRAGVVFKKTRFQEAMDAAVIVSVERWA